MSENDLETTPVVSTSAVTLDSAARLAEALPGLMPETLKKIDKGLSSGIEGILNCLNYHGLECWNHRRKLIADRNMRSLIALKSAATRSMCHLIHPSMITVAENLSPDEALILSQFPSNYGNHRIPMIDINFVDTSPKGKNETDKCADYFSELTETPGLMNTDQIDFYIGLYSYPKRKTYYVSAFRRYIAIRIIH